MDRKVEDLSQHDQREVRKFKRYLKLKATKRGRWFLTNQKYWKEYQGL